MKNLKNNFKHLQQLALGGLLFITLLSSCSKSSNDEKPATPVPGSVKDIYICGWRYASTGKKQGTYWKNGVAFSVTDGTYDAELVDIEVIGNDVYTCGFENNGTLNVSKLWKNNIGSVLSFLPNNKVFGLASINNDIYVAGIKTNNEYGYWKNDTNNFTLIPNSNFAEPVGITTSGTDIYTFVYSNVGVNCYKNNSFIRKLGNSQFKPSSIKVDGTNLYVAGDYNGKATYFKNATEVQVSSQASKIFDIDVINDDVYICGSETVTAKYWKNVTPISPNTTGIYESYLKGIKVVGNDVYVCGDAYNYGVSFTTSRFWKNQTRTELTEPINGTSRATSIFITYN